MRQVLAVVVLMAVSGCTKSPIIDPPSVVCTGDVTITSSAEMDAFVARGCTSVTGTLSISGTDLTRVSLPGLRSVGEAGQMPTRDACGDMNVRYSTALSICANNLLRSIDLPGLTSIHSAVFLDNPALDSLNIPSLATILEPPMFICGKTPCGRSGGLSVVETSAEPVGLTSLNLPALASGDIMVSSLGLTNLSLPALASGGVGVDESGVTSLSLPALAEGSVTVTKAVALRAVILPALTTGTVSLADNAVLDHVDIPALMAGSVWITGNLSLSACDALGLLADLRAIGFEGRSTISGNGSSAICPTLSLCQGVAITSSQEWIALVEAGCKEIVGDLKLEATAMTDVPAYPGLQVIDGGLDIKGNPALASMSLPDLTTVGWVWVADSPAVASLDLRALRTGDLSVNDCPALLTLDLPSLESGGVGVFATGVTQLVLSALTTGSISIWSTELAVLTLPKLTEAQLYVVNNRALSAVNAPALKLAERVEVRSNGLLTRMDLPSLTGVGGFGGLFITGNISYPECAAEAILAQLSAPPAAVDISGNDTAATCPP
jgi:hypothetical protein